MVVNRQGKVKLASQVRVARYARVSTQRQDDDDKVSITEQLLAIEDYCNERSYVIVETYQEVGPGTSKKRPEFQRMLSDARDGCFDVIVCWKSDRLSRGMCPAVALMEAVENTNARVEAVQETIDMDTFALMAWVGSRELKNLKERSMLGKRGRAKIGKIPCSAIPFGYMTDEEGFPFIDEDAANVVRYIYHLSVSEGLGARQISIRLDNEQIPTPKQSKSGWNKGSIAGILRNPAYKGDYLYGVNRHVRTDEGKFVTQQPEETWVHIPMPPIVDEETWERAQEATKLRLTRSQRNTKVFYLLQHLVICEVCGRLMGGFTQRRRKVLVARKAYTYEFDPPRRRYQCYGSQEAKVGCRNPKGMWVEVLDDLVWQEAVRIIKDPEFIIAGIEFQGLDSRGLDVLTEQINAAEKEIENADREIEIALELHMKGKVTEKEYDKATDPVRKRQKYYSDLLGELRERHKAGQIEAHQKEQVKKWARAIAQSLDDMTEEERQELLRNLFTRITINGENEVTFTVGLPDKDFFPIESAAAHAKAAAQSHPAFACAAAYSCVAAAHGWREREGRRRASRRRSSTPKAAGFAESVLEPQRPVAGYGDVPVAVGRGVLGAGAG